MLEKARKRLRITTTSLDSDIQQLIDEALDDIKRIGIDTSTVTPLTEGAVLCYVKANFGNNPDRDKLMESYNMYLTKLKGLKISEG
ncbi:MAG: putative phage packaging-like protein [Eubacterium sp.]|jgi:hypothetical protein|nr:putative phage packaging-like protein [Eubacterium sp.]